MVTIEITEEVEDENTMADVLELVAEMVRDGYTSGIDPSWHLLYEVAENEDND